MKYRKEIDGLRAIAVVSVIFFHAGFTFFGGGFVGVDVFFVISGYLIASNIIDDIENKSFSFLNFYEKRARRIVPALFFMILFTLPFAWFGMLPHQLKEFAESLVSVALFASNIYFYLTSNYFDISSEFKPLLHTWSIAVEVQFYFIFPFLLTLIWRLERRYII
jgi:peptidoglycan/LPS O-acetylase OafA/YrhL